MNRRGLLFALLGTLLGALAAWGGGRWLWRKLRDLHGPRRRPHS
jgi:uncharacterized membrane protein YccC